MLKVNRYSPVSYLPRPTAAKRAEALSPEAGAPSNMQRLLLRDVFEGAKLVKDMTQRMHSGDDAIGGATLRNDLTQQVHSGDDAIGGATLRNDLTQQVQIPTDIDITKLDLNNRQVVADLAKKLGIEQVNLNKRTNDVEFDGALVGVDKAIKQKDLGGKNDLPPVSLQDIEGYTPNTFVHRPERGTIIQINGINTTLEQQKQALQATADATGAKVVGIHNATEGLAGDLQQSVGDKLNVGNNPAVTSLANVILQELRAGRPVHLMAHSQGGLITSRAIEEVTKQLKSEFEDVVNDDGQRVKRDKTRLLYLIKVETFGAASGRYPDGPRYVHYVNTKDPVSNLFGVEGALSFFNHKGKDSKGEEAKVIPLTEKSLIQAHSYTDVYLKERKNFDEVYDPPSFRVQQRY
ncbi:hypothetical protein F0U62_13595 [Cystobacter fuscus]|uniref:hypothetical protein n=1 Tax=Cystobacter fuscus TaxID=43 RepID=UPI002B291F84|nr:hypothetical protein F0U62_13595 [Cystobacter fuscus]